MSETWDVFDRDGMRVASVSGPNASSGALYYATQYAAGGEGPMVVKKRRQRKRTQPNEGGEG